jgi:hypothetical protein
MENDLNILHPVREVPVTGRGQVEVREMRWKPALAYVQKLSGVLGEFIEGGRLVVTPEKLTGVLVKSADLAGELIVRSTNLSPTDVDDLYPSEALALLQAAIEVNLHEDLLGKARGVGRALQGALGVAVAPAAGAG